MTRPVPLYARLGAGLAALLACGGIATGQGKSAADAAAAQPPFPEATVYSAQTPPPPADLAAPAKVAAAMGRVETFEDWAVGCDNHRTCTLVSLLPEAGGEPYPLLMLITRATGPSAPVEMRLAAADPMRGKMDVVADGKSLATVTLKGGDGLLAGEAALRTAQQLGRSFTLEVRQGRRAIVRPSISGLSAALRYVDQQQGRVGTADALTGNGTASARPAAPPRSNDQAGQNKPARAGREPAQSVAVPPLTPAEEARARKIGICEGLWTSRYALELHWLDAAHALALLPCDAGAYNVSFVPLVASGAVGARAFALARFDHIPGASGDPATPPLVVNARWNPRLATLASFAKGRGLGDCGTAEDYRWDGERFRLTEARAMPVCRGAWEWPRIFEAR